MYRFEQDLHAASDQGELGTKSVRYGQTQQEMFGDSVTLTKTTASGGATSVTSSILRFMSTPRLQRDATLSLFQRHDRTGTFLYISSCCVPEDQDTGRIPQTVRFTARPHGFWNEGIN